MWKSKENEKICLEIEKGVVLRLHSSLLFLSAMPSKKNTNLINTVRSLITEFRIVFRQVTHIFQCNVRTFRWRLSFKIGIDVVHCGETAVIDLKI